jgi:hypothetical protein
VGGQCRRRTRRRGVRIFDDAYREISRVRAGNGYRGDLHEFLITPQDTALLTAYAEVPADLSPVGGGKYGAVWDGIAQGVDIETGEVHFEWHSLDHVGVEEFYVAPLEDPAYIYDYFHINSIDVDYDGDLLISARNTWTVYKVDRATGEVVWRLGGKESDFEMGEGTRPSPSTTPAARRMAPSPSSTTARTRRYTSSRERSCFASTRRR